MTARSFALVFGILYLGAGVLGLFPVNLLHTLVHVAIGAWGLWAFMRHASPTFFARSVALFYGVLGVMGLIPGLNTVFGLIPLHGHNVWLHLGTAAIAACIGWPDMDRRKALALARG